MAGKSQRKTRKLKIQLKDFFPSQLKSIATVEELKGKIDAVISSLDAMASRLRSISGPKLTKNVKVSLQNLVYGLQDLRNFYKERRKLLSPDNQALIEQTKHSLSSFFLLISHVRLLESIVKVDDLPHVIEKRALAVMNKISTVIDILSNHAVLVPLYDSVFDNIIVRVYGSPRFEDEFVSVSTTKTPLAYVPNILSSVLVNPVLYNSKDVFNEFLPIREFDKINVVSQEGNTYLLLSRSSDADITDKIDDLRNRAASISEYVKYSFIQVLPSIERAISLITGESINLGEYIRNREDIDAYNHFSNILTQPSNIHWVDKDGIEKNFNLFINSLSPFVTKAKIDLTKYFDVTDEILEAVKGGYGLLDAFILIQSELRHYEGVKVNLTKLKEEALKSYSDSVMAIARDELEIAKYVLRQVKSAGITFETENVSILTMAALPSKETISYYTNQRQELKNDPKVLREIVEIDNRDFVPLFTRGDLALFDKHLAILSFLGVLRVAKDVYPRSIAVLVDGEVKEVYGVVAPSSDIANKVLSLMLSIKSIETIDTPTGRIRALKASINKTAAVNPQEYYYFDVLPETEGMLNLIHKYIGSRALVEKVTADDILQVGKHSPFSFDASQLLLESVPLQPAEVEKIISEGYSPIVGVFTADIRASDEANGRVWVEKGVILGNPVILDITDPKEITVEKLKTLFDKYIQPVAKNYRITMQDVEIKPVWFYEEILKDPLLGETLNGIVERLVNAKNEAEFYERIEELEKKYENKRDKYLFDLALNAIRKVFMLADSLACKLGSPSRLSAFIRRYLDFDIVRFTKDYFEGKISKIAYFLTIKAIFNYIFSGLNIDGNKFFNGFGELFNIERGLDVLIGTNSIDTLIDIVCRFKTRIFKRHGEISLEEYLSEAYEGRIEIGEETELPEEEEEEEEVRLPEGEEEEPKEEAEEEEAEPEEEVYYARPRARRLFSLTLEKKPALIVHRGFEEMEIRGTKNTAIYWSDRDKNLHERLSRKTAKGIFYQCESVEFVICDYTDIPPTTNNLSKPLFVVKDVFPKILDIILKDEKITKSLAKELNVESISPTEKGKIAPVLWAERYKKTFITPPLGSEDFVTTILTTDVGDDNNLKVDVMPLGIVVVGQEIIGPFVVRLNSTKDEVLAEVRELLGDIESLTPDEVKRKSVLISQYFANKTQSFIDSYVKSKLRGLFRTNPWFGTIVSGEGNVVVFKDRPVPLEEAIDLMYESFKLWLSKNGIDLVEVVNKIIPLRKVSSKKKTAATVSGLEELLKDVQVKAGLLGKLTELSNQLVAIARDCNITIEKLINRWIKDEFQIEAKHGDLVASWSSDYYRYPTSTVKEFKDLQVYLETTNSNLGILLNNFKTQVAPLRIFLKQYVDQEIDAKEFYTRISGIKSLVEDILYDKIPQAAVATTKASEILADLALIKSVSEKIPSRLTLGIAEFSNPTYDSYPLLAFDYNVLTSCSGVIYNLIQKVNELINSFKVDISEEVIKSALELADFDALNPNLKTEAEEIIKFLNDLETILHLTSVHDIPLVLQPVAARPIGGARTLSNVVQNNIRGFAVPSVMKNIQILDQSVFPAAGTVDIHPLLYECSVCKSLYPIDELIVRGQGKTLFEYLLEKLPDTSEYLVTIPKGSNTLTYYRNTVSLDKEALKPDLKRLILDPLRGHNSQNLPIAIENITKGFANLVTADRERAEKILTLYSLLCHASDRINIAAICPVCGSNGTVGDFVVEVRREGSFRVKVLVQNVFRRYDFVRTGSDTLDVAMIISYNDPLFDIPTPVVHHVVARFVVDKDELANKDIKTELENLVTNYIKKVFVPLVISGRTEITPSDENIRSVAEQLGISMTEARELFTYYTLDRARLIIPEDSIIVEFDAQDALLFKDRNEIIKGLKEKQFEDVYVPDYAKQPDTEVNYGIEYELNSLEVDYAATYGVVDSVNILVIKRIYYYITDKKTGKRAIINSSTYDMSGVIKVKYDPNHNTFYSDIASELVKEIQKDQVVTNIPRVELTINIEGIQRIVDPQEFSKILDAAVSNNFQTIKFKIDSGRYTYKYSEAVSEFYKSYVNDKLEQFIRGLSEYLTFTVPKIVQNKYQVSSMSPFLTISAADYVKDVVLSFIRDHMRLTDYEKSASRLLEDLMEKEELRIAFVSYITKELVADRLYEYLTETNIVNPSTINSKQFYDIIKSALAAYVNKYVNRVWNPDKSIDPNLMFGNSIEISVSNVLNDIENFLKSKDLIKQTLAVAESRIRSYDIPITIVYGTWQGFKEEDYITIEVTTQEESAKPVVRLFKIWMLTRPGAASYIRDIVVLDRELALSIWNELRRVIVSYIARKASLIAGGNGEFTEKMEIRIKEADLQTTLELPDTITMVSSGTKILDYVKSNTSTLDTKDDYVNLSAAILNADYNNFTKSYSLLHRTFSDTYMNLEIHVDISNISVNLLDKNAARAFAANQHDVQAILYNRICEVSFDSSYYWKLKNITSATNKKTYRFEFVLIPEDDQINVLNYYLSLAVLDAIANTIDELSTKFDMTTLADYIFTVKIFSPVQSVKYYLIKLINATSMIKSRGDMVALLYSPMTKREKAEELWHYYDSKYGYSSRAEKGLRKLVDYRRVIDYPTLDISYPLGKINQMLIAPPTSTPPEEVLTPPEEARIPQPEPELSYPVFKVEGGVVTLTKDKKPSGADFIKFVGNRVSFDKIEFNNEVSVTDVFRNVLLNALSKGSAEDEALNNLIEKIKNSPNTSLIMNVAEVEGKEVLTSLWTTMSRDTETGKAVSWTIDELQLSNNIFLRLVGIFAKKYNVIAVEYV